MGGVKVSNINSHVFVKTFKLNEQSEYQLDEVAKVEGPLKKIK